MDPFGSLERSTDSSSELCFKTCLKNITYICTHMHVIYIHIYNYDYLYIKQESNRKLAKMLIKDIVMCAALKKYLIRRPSSRCNNY